MKTLSLTPELYHYILEMNPIENTFLEKLRVKTDKLKYARLRSTTEQMHFICFLLRYLKPKKILELGTFTGYMTLAMALSTAPTTSIVTCDINNIFPSEGKEIWKDANVENRIDLRLGPALDTLKTLVEKDSLFDFIYIDADKENSIAYFELALNLLTHSGMIIVDNVLWKGKVIDPFSTESTTEAIRRFNEHLKSRQHIHYCLLPMGDGLSLITKGQSDDQ